MRDLYIKNKFDNQEITYLPPNPSHEHLHVVFIIYTVDNNNNNNNNNVILIKNNVADGGFYHKPC